MIKRIRVQNFKSLRDVDLELGARNVLVGPNMSGKSNVIDTFRFLSHLATLSDSGMVPLAGALSKFGELRELAWKGGDTQGFHLTVEGSTPSAPPGRSSVLAAIQRPGGHRGQGFQFQYELAILGNEWGFGQVQHERLELTENGETWEAIATEQSTRLARRRDGTTISQTGNPGAIALQQNISEWEGNAVRSTFAAFRFYRLVPDSMKKAVPTAASPFLQETGENLASWLMTVQTRHKGWFARVEMAMADAFPDIVSLFTEPTQQSTVSVNSEERFLRGRTPVFQMSDGELAFLALLSLIYAPPELGSPLYCVEEPENHLHPKLLETFVELLKQRQTEPPKEERPTFVFTTHSPLLLDHFDVDDVVVVEKREGATVCTRPSERAHLKELLQRKELGLGDLFYSGALGGG